MPVTSAFHDGDTPCLRVTFFGDSICYGQHVSPHLGWVTRIGAQLEAEATAAGRPQVRLINASISGNTTRMALERMPFDVQSHRVDIGYVQFGLNDLNCWLTDGGLPRVSPAAFAANLHEMIDRMERCGARHVLIGTNHPTTRDVEPMAGTSTTFESCNLRYNELIRIVASARGETVVLVDHAAAWQRALDDGIPLSSLVMHDGLHLARAGHDLYLATCAPVMSRLASAFAYPGGV
jgi:lysophospholipase L1-like esterase